MPDIQLNELRTCSAAIDKEFARMEGHIDSLMTARVAAARNTGLIPSSCVVEEGRDVASSSDGRRPPGRDASSHRCHCFSGL
jgi:hypothetical protein